MTAAEGDVTRLLAAWSRGDEVARAHLLNRVYPDLRRIAARYLRRERPDHTLETSGLVHEAFLRLVEQRQVSWRCRAQFFGVAAQMMRRILVDHARRQRYLKRGGALRRVVLEAGVEALDQRITLPDLDDALEDLMTHAPPQARVVELRFFGGLSHDEIAEVLGVSVPTVTRRWRVARAWLYRRLTQGSPRGA